MSINKTQTVRCPVCSQTGTVTVWSFVSVPGDKDLREELLKGRLNMFECALCGARALMPEPFIYNDEENGFMLSFVAGLIGRGREETLSQMNETLEKSGEKKELSGKRLRLVADYNDLIEKTLVLEAGLCDKTTELLKLMVLMQEPDKAENRVCRFGRADVDKIEFAVFDKSDSTAYTSRVPRETYNTVKKSLYQSGVKDYKGEWELVDSEYASRLLGGINN